MSNQVKITGLRETNARLRLLPTIVANRVVTKALRKAATPMLRQARAMAPKKTGNLKKNIVLKSFTYRRYEWRKGVLIGIRQKAKVEGQTARELNDAFYGKFHELGYFAGKRKSHQRANAGKRRRALTSAHSGHTWVPARPFMGPAYQAKKMTFVRDFHSETERLIPVEVGKYYRIK